jgi:glycosyltransferase involved in cell wall biosynthesis
MARPRIGLNLLYLAPGETGGMEVYARALVPALLRAWPAASFVAFCGRELAAEMRRSPWAPGLTVVELPVSPVSRFARVAAEQALLPPAIARHRIDLLHSLATTMPAVAATRTVTTVHDLIYARFPETHAGVLSRGMSVLARVAVQRATRLVAISEATKRDLIELLGVDPARVDVVPNGPGLDPTVAPTPEAELRTRLGLGDAPIVLSVSATRPHKNLARLIRAIAASKAEPAPVLVVPGYAHPHEETLRELAASLAVAERVRFVGWMADADLEGLYAAARLMAFPSLAEGFGLPVLEAMRRGVPVACSDATSLPEVAGDAALLFDPESVEAIRDAIDRLLADPALRAELGDRGRQRAAVFSWERTAQGTVGSYRRALS